MVQWLHVGLHLCSCSTLATVSTLMADCLLTGKLSRYVPNHQSHVRNHLGQLSLPSLRGRLIEYQPVWLGLGEMRSLALGGR